MDEQEIMFMVYFHAAIGRYDNMEVAGLAAREAVAIHQRYNGHWDDDEGADDDEGIRPG